ncbi:unnamed protein product [Somion occarium]|uniref:Zn(2)-C6 fungal-type domain-containing protein n=1 Tax=Somion occarium TaxID=3059160 RepID=A0ABP1EAE4_9APHY
MPDLPSSPRKSISSASANARSQPQKKPGAPKPKGAVRAKSGCYTCRIRRKKCDEKPNEAGACETCVRLRLQCLGFGAKRPEWMRENNSVTELREKIKTFLASQGMIKGHSGSGPRTTDGDPPVLVLVDNLHPHGNPSSPPTPTLSTTSSDGPQHHQRPPQQHPSQMPYVRDGPHQPPHHYAPMSPEASYTAPPPPPPRPNGTYSSLPTSSLVPSYTHHHHQQQQQYHRPTNPAVISSFSSLYNPPYHFSADDDELEPTNPVTESISPSIYDWSIMGPSIPSDQTPLLRHYLQNVMPMQYMLADASISDLMYNLLQSSASARDAACMLAAFHVHSMRSSSNNSQSLVPAFFERLRGSLANKQSYAEGDAMAGLHVVSTYLFSGGRGPWNVYLGIASQYVRDVLSNPKFFGPEDVLKTCSESTRFIIKTTMWFDVLASVTTQQVPTFLKVYRELFGRTGAYIDDPAPEISMLPVMGCENHIVLAIAEISNLAYWKSVQQQRGSLSMPDLVARGLDIEEKWLKATASPFPSPPSLPAHIETNFGSLGLGSQNGARHHANGVNVNVNGINGVNGVNGHNGVNGGAAHRPPPTPTTTTTTTTANLHQNESDIAVAHRRRLTNDIFRASARVYLHTVLSGDFPSCPEIMKAVADTIECLSRVPRDTPSVHRGVVRSVVFGICICGCLTDDQRQRKFLLDLLDSQQKETVGNVSEVRCLMEEVWQRRGDKRGPVNWREVMREGQKELLLLV